MGVRELEYFLAVVDSSSFKSRSNTWALIWCLAVCLQPRCRTARVVTNEWGSASTRHCTADAGTTIAVPVPQSVPIGHAAPSCTVRIRQGIPTINCRPGPGLLAFPLLALGNNGSSRAHRPRWAHHAPQSVIIVRPRSTFATRPSYRTSGK